MSLIDLAQMKPPAAVKVGGLNKLIEIGAITETAILNVQYLSQETKTVMTGSPEEMNGRHGTQLNLSLLKDP